MAADAAGQEVRQEERAKTVAKGLQRRLRRVHRPDRQQQFCHCHTTVRQFHVQRDPEVFAAVTGARTRWFASHRPPPVGDFGIFQGWRSIRNFSYLYFYRFQISMKINTNPKLRIWGGPPNNFARLWPCPPLQDFHFKIKRVIFTLWFGRLKNVILFIFGNSNIVYT